MSLNWLFVDLNSYFASVEQQIKPELRGKPVGVVPLLSDTTVCIAASYEAKKFGVKTGTRVADARKMCPGIVFVEADHGPYLEYHDKIVEAVESCLHVSVISSIDEMACRLTGRDQNLQNAINLGHQVKNAIITKVGSELNSSVGLAPNRYLAKVASDMQKPNGMTVIELKDLPNKLLPLKLRDFPGIGPKMEERLRQFSITTTEKLLSLDIYHLRQAWGGPGGDRFFHWLRGDDLEIEYGENKSIGQSHVLSPELRNLESAYLVMQKMLQKAAARLRKINHWSSRLSVGIQYLDKTEWAARTKMQEAQDTHTLLDVLEKLWAGRREGRPLKVSVTLLNLIPDKEHNLSLFDDLGKNELSHALDNLNTKFGKDTIYFGGAHSVKKSAPTRIAFAKIPKGEAD